MRGLYGCAGGPNSLAFFERDGIEVSLRAQMVFGENVCPSRADAGKFKNVGNPDIIGLALVQTEKGKNAVGISVWVNGFCRYYAGTACRGQQDLLIAVFPDGVVAAESDACRDRPCRLHRW